MTFLINFHKQAKEIVSYSMIIQIGIHQYIVSSQDVLNLKVYKAQNKRLGKLNKHIKLKTM